MKKIFYSFAILSLLFTSCNPIEDIYEELDSKAKIEGIVGDVSRTLSDEDYETLDLSYGNFSSIDDAKSLLPDFLSAQYPALGVSYNEDGSINKASSAAITYKLYSPIKFESYTVTDADYTALGLTSLNDSDDFNDFFANNFPSEVKGTVVDLTYQTEPTITDYTLTDADYLSVGNTYKNFDIRVGRDEETIDARRLKIQTILLANFPDAPDATKYNVSYEVYDGSVSNLEMEVKQQQNQPDASLTTNYTLTEADFALVGNSQYNNFDVRDGKDEQTVEARRAKIETILLNNFPAATTGDLYNVTYDIYNGTNTTDIMLVEFDGTGYAIFNTTSYELYTFVLEEATTRFTLSNEWAAPITFTNDEYTLMGQRYPNFSDKDEAEYKIGIYLKTLYQFAAADDFVAVEYDYYSGSVGAENVNYVFDGSVWNAIPTVIDNVLKFGHNGTNWVPDNTIKYTLTNADFDSVGNGFYNNFDIRTGKDEETVEARLVKINIILKANFPAAEEGQKFSVTYDVYDGTNSTRTTNVVKTGADYILQ
jgi:hypothetical protein